MKNFIFISPNFPTNYWQFCRELKNDGMNVLGIGDQPYDELKPELKDSLNEYYKVGSLENYDEVYRAVAFLTFKHGRIDWLESNNEYWLERDAALRTDFHITSGFQTSDMPCIKYKSNILVKAGQDVGCFVQRDDCQFHIRGDGSKIDLATAPALRQCRTDVHINGDFLGTNNGIRIIFHRHFLLFSKEKDPTGSFQFISCQRSSLC